MKTFTIIVGLLTLSMSASCGSGHSSDKTNGTDSLSEVSAEKDTMNGNTVSDAAASSYSVTDGHFSGDSLPVINPVIGDLPLINVGTVKEWEWAIETVNNEEDWGSNEKYSEHQRRLLSMVSDGEGAVTRGIGCSWYCCAWPDTVYSSTHIGKNVHDLNLLTSWIVNANDAIGQSVTIVFPAGVARITTFEIWNGYDRDETNWFNYGRVAEFKLLINGVPSAIFVLDDTPKCQKFGIKPLTSPDKETPLVLTLEITKIYPGKKYDKVAVSEINFDGIDCH